METNKVKILVLKLKTLPGKSQRLKAGFGSVFRIIFTLLKLKQKELALNSVEKFCS